MSISAAADGRERCTRDYIAALRSTPLSLFDVSGVVSGEAMLLRDLVHDGDPVALVSRAGAP
jgi:hypothetical protein